MSVSCLFIVGVPIPGPSLLPNSVLASLGHLICPLLVNAHWLQSGHLPPGLGFPRPAGELLGYQEVWQFRISVGIP